MKKRLFAMSLCFISSGALANSAVISQATVSVYCPPSVTCQNNVCSTEMNSFQAYPLQYPLPDGTYPFVSAYSSNPPVGGRYPLAECEYRKNGYGVNYTSTHYIAYLNPEGNLWGYVWTGDYSCNSTNPYACPLTLISSNLKISKVK